MIIVVALALVVVVLFLQSPPPPTPVFYFSSSPHLIVVIFSRGLLGVKSFFKNQSTYCIFNTTLLPSVKVIQQGMCHVAKYTHSHIHANHKTTKTCYNNNIKNIVIKNQGKRSLVDKYINFAALFFFPQRCLPCSIGRSLPLSTSCSSPLI